MVSLSFLVMLATGLCLYSMVVFAFLFSFCVLFLMFIFIALGFVFLFWFVWDCLFVVWICIYADSLFFCVEQMPISLNRRVCVCVCAWVCEEVCNCICSINTDCFFFRASQKLICLKVCMLRLRFRLFVYACSLLIACSSARDSVLIVLICLNQSIANWILSHCVRFS